MYCFPRKVNCSTRKDKCFTRKTWDKSIGDRYSHHISNLLIQSCCWINKYIYTLWQHTNTYTQFRKKY